MHAPHISTKRHLSRRTLLKGAGASLALPLLDAMMPAFARTAAAEEVPRRMVAICVDLGFLPDSFFPKGDGRGYELSPYLKTIGEHRDDFTVFSGVSHPDVTGGHQADVSFLTGAAHPTRPGFKNSVSLDQYAAEFLGHKTRVPTLSLRVGPNGTLSFTRDGVPIPAEMKPSTVYRQLFVQGSEEEVEAQVRKLRDGRSLMDSLSGRINSLKRDVNGPDRERLDQFFESVREVEKRLEMNEGWERKPKPKVEEQMPKDVLDPGALVTRTRAMYDLTRLALETDSTRLVTIFVTQGFNPKVDLPGVEIPHHALTHQASLNDSRKQLEIIEEAQMKEFGRLMGELKTVKEGNETLLDRTMLFQGSNLGNAGAHDNSNLPVLLAGGGFRHGQHLAFSRAHNKPLANIYVSMLQRLGIEAESFSTGKSTMTGLDPV
jgi:hypothetical protein